MVNCSALFGSTCTVERIIFHISSNSRNVMLAFLGMVTKRHVGVSRHGHKTSLGVEFCLQNYTNTGK